MSDENYALLRTFRTLFEGKPYRHRIANLGDLVASNLYEDLVALGKSAKLTERVQRHERVVNLKNLMTGKPGHAVMARLASSFQLLLRSPKKECSLRADLLQQSRSVPKPRFWPKQ